MISVGLLLAACGGAIPVPTPTSTAVPAPTESAIPPTPGVLPNALTIWLSPRFAPDPESAAGPILQQRLQDFEAAHAGVQLTIRVKAESGPGGLPESLATASQAASATLPDLAILGAEALADSNPLLVPDHRLALPGAALERYDFARPLANASELSLGVPFAAELELFAYRTASHDSPPMTWGALFTDQGDFLIPASDPESRFLIAQYLALGGSLDEIDPDPLAVALGFVASANEAGALAPSSVDFASSSETWAAFLAGRGAIASAPYSGFVASFEPLDYSAGPLPTSDGRGISLAKPWSWVLLNDQPIEATGSSNGMAAALLEWLTDPAFLAEWTYALGLVPVQPAVLERWPDTPETAIASRLVAVAVPLPDPDTLADFGPAFAAALRAVLDRELSPQEAAALAAANGR